MSKTKRKSQPSCSPETVAKLAEAVQCVLDHAWGGYWSFLKPCRDAMAAYKAETDLCKCGKQTEIVVHGKGGKETRVCWDCFISKAKNNAFQLLRKDEA